MSIFNFLKKIFNHEKPKVEIQLEKIDNQEESDNDNPYSITKILRNSTLSFDSLGNIVENNNKTFKPHESISFDRWSLTKDKDKVYERFYTDIFFNKTIQTIAQYLEDNKEIVKGNENLIILLLTNINKDIDIKPNFESFDCKYNAKLFNFDLINFVICTDIVKLIKKICQIYTKYIFCKLDLGTYVSNCLGKLLYNESSMLVMKAEINKRISYYEQSISESILNDLIDIVNLSLGDD